MSVRRVVTSASADEDILGAIDYYVLSGAIDAASGFIDALQDAKDLIAEFPAIGSSRFALETQILVLRDVGVKRFPFIIFYTDDADAVRIHRVLHTSRDLPVGLAGA